MKNQKKEAFSKAAPEKIGECVKIHRPYMRNALGNVGCSIPASTMGFIGEIFSKLGDALLTCTVDHNTVRHMALFQEDQAKAQQQFLEQKKKYEGMGWTLHDIRGGTLFYACPPGVTPTAALEEERLRLKIPQ